jgi:hypothetical protein
LPLTILKFGEDGKIDFDATRYYKMLYHGTIIRDISFDDDSGKITSGVTAGSFVYKGIQFSKGAAVSFYENGTLVEASYPGGEDDFKIGGRVFDGEEGITFYRNGKVKNGTLRNKTNLGIWIYPSGTKVHFYRYGALLAAQNEGGTQGRYLYSGEYPVIFHKNGKIRTAKLAEEGEFGGKHYPGGTIVHFDANGRFLPEKVDIEEWEELLEREENLDAGGRAKSPIKGGKR